MVLTAQQHRNSTLRAGHPLWLKAAVCDTKVAQAKSTGGIGLGAAGGGQEARAGGGT